MADLFDNPMGLMGFEFVEFASPDARRAGAAVRDDGLHAGRASTAPRTWCCTARATSTSSSTASRRAWPAYFAAEHGPSACGMAFRVKDAHKAYARALELGAQPVEMPTGPMELRLPAIKGIGGAPLYLIDRFEDGKSIYDIDFEFLAGRRAPSRGPRPEAHRPPDAQRLPRPHGATGPTFYEKLFNFREIRYFDIKGEYTGLTSQGDDRARRQDPHPAERGSRARARARSRSS